MGTAKRIGIGLLVLALTSVQAVPIHAETVVPSARVVINEIQTESNVDANQEFIELVNISADTVDLSGWSIQYRAASGTTWSDKAVLSGELYPNGSIIIATQGYLSDKASFFWTPTGGIMSATGGNIRIMPANSVAAEDTVAWGTGIYGETVAAEKAPKGSSLQRKVVDLKPVDTDNNSLDFESITPSPTSLNTAPVQDPQNVPPVPVNPPDPIPVTPDPVTDPTVPDPTTPTDPGNTATTDTQPPVPVSTNPSPAPTPDPTPVNETPQTPVVLDPLVINELMIDPALPQADAQDEWVELYNPNDTTFSLTGYKLQTGGTFSHSYTFTDGSVEPHGYVVLRSSQTGLQLSNTSGAVRLMAPDGLVSGDIVTYDDSEEGNAYALNNSSTWLWTTTPSPLAANIFTVKQELLPPVQQITKTSTKSAPKSTAVKSSNVKTTAVKAETTSAKKTSSTSAKQAKASSATSDSPSPIAVSETPSHPAALAGFALLAVGYALYEYREDLANKLRLARRYLEARRGRRAGV